MHQIFPWDQFGVFKIIGKVRVLKLSQSAFLCSVSHMTTFFLNSRVWWISKIKRAKRLSQALVHLVIVRASRSWFKLWVMSEGRKHVPYVQCTMLFVQYDIQLWHGTLGVISHISKYSMFPCSRSFLSTARWMGWTHDFASVCFHRFSTSRFGCVSNWRFNLGTASLPVWSCSWTVVWQSLHPEVYFTATDFPVLSLARMVGGCSRVKACSILAPTMHVRFRYILCDKIGDWFVFTVQFFSWHPHHHPFDAHCTKSVVQDDHVGSRLMETAIRYCEQMTPIHWLMCFPAEWP